MNKIPPDNPTTCCCCCCCCKKYNLWLAYQKPTMPVLAIANANPRMPLPMMAFIRLKTQARKESPLVLVGTVT